MESMSRKQWLTKLAASILMAILTIWIIVAGGFLLAGHSILHLSPSALFSTIALSILGFVLLKNKSFANSSDSKK